MNGGKKLFSRAEGRSDSDASGQTFKPKSGLSTSQQQSSISRTGASSSDNTSARPEAKSKVLVLTHSLSNEISTRAGRNQEESSAPRHSESAGGILLRGDAAQSEVRDDSFATQPQSAERQQAYFPNSSKRDLRGQNQQPSRDSRLQHYQPGSSGRRNPRDQSTSGSVRSASRFSQDSTSIHDRERGRRVHPPPRRAFENGLPSILESSQHREQTQRGDTYQEERRSPWNVPRSPEKAPKQRALSDDATAAGFYSRGRGSRGGGGRARGESRSRGRGSAHNHSITRRPPTTHRTNIFEQKYSDEADQTETTPSSKLPTPSRFALESHELLSRGSGRFDRNFIYQCTKALALHHDLTFDDSQFIEIVDVLQERFDGIDYFQRPLTDLFGNQEIATYFSESISAALGVATKGLSVKDHLKQVCDRAPEDIRYPGLLDRDWITKWIIAYCLVTGRDYKVPRLLQVVGNCEEAFEDIGYLGLPLEGILNNRENRAELADNVLACFDQRLVGVYRKPFWKAVDTAYGIDLSKLKTSADESAPREGTTSTAEAKNNKSGPTFLKPASMATFESPFLGQFLNQINGLTKAQNEKSLGEFVVLEPPFEPSYQSIIGELSKHYPRGREDQLESRCTNALTVARDGIDGCPSWSQFTKFMVQYLTYLRDVNSDPSKYLETYELLYELQKRANSALVHPQLGGLMLPIVINCARLICRLAIGLDRQPELIAHVKSADSEEGPRQTLPERAAELLRGGLVTCLNDRYSGLDGFGKPEGKKRGIYKIANICLKIFFQCRKTRNAEMIFTNIGNLSPPLAAYPKKERVTYLYYLGRFWFQNSHFLRARMALQAAYDESPAHMGCVRQRRQILIYLMASNIIMGRFPMPLLFQRPEAQGLYERFMPIMQAIRSGNLALFRHHLDMNGPHADWFLHFRILLQLRNRCEVLVWRSLVRKAYILFGTPYVPGEKATAPLIDLENLTSLFQALERQSLKQEFISYVDPDLDGMEDDEEQSAEDGSLLPSITSIESILSSLVEQGFLTGFISHAKLKFVIQGAKQMGGNVLAAGFPQPWAAIEKRASGDHAGLVPGWKLADTRGAASAPAGGMVVNMSGARPVGAA